MVDHRKPLREMGRCFEFRGLETPFPIQIYIHILASPERQPSPPLFGLCSVRHRQHGKSISGRCNSHYSLTVDIQLHQSNTEPVLDKQSLAIVFLPTYLPSLPPHTLFLPVIAAASHDPAAGELDKRERQVYEQQWSIFKISKKQHLFPRAATVLAEDEVDRMEASEVVQAFGSLQPLRRKIFRGIKNQVATAPALTMYVISPKL